jgi:hypothetical protein
MGNRQGTPYPEYGGFGGFLRKSLGNEYVEKFDGSSEEY